MKLYVNYRETRTGGDICEGQEGDSWPDHEPTYIEYWVTNVTTKNVTPYHEEVEIECERTPLCVFVVIARYQTGDTFGYSTGNGCIAAVTLELDDAQKIVDKINKGTYRSRHGYNPWEGYFEKLESVDYELHQVLCPE